MKVQIQYLLKSLQHLDAGKLCQRRVQWTRQGRRMHARNPRRHRVQDASKYRPRPKGCGHETITHSNVNYFQHLALIKGSELFAKIYFNIAHDFTVDLIWICEFAQIPSRFCSAMHQNGSF